MDHATQGTPRRDLLKGAAGIAVGAATVGALGGNSVSAAGQTAITLVLDDLPPIELVSSSWGASNSINIGSQTGGGGAGKATFDGLDVTKYVDHSSTVLLQRLLTGAHFDRGVLTVGPKVGPVTTLDLRLVLVTAMTAAGQAADNRSTENVTLVFGALQYQVDGQTANSSAP